MSLRPRTACRDRGAARGQARRRRGRLDLGRVVHAAAADAGRPWGAQIQSVSRVLPCRTWHAFFIRPETLLRWHRRLIARRWTYPHRRPGRPPLDKEVRELILRLAQENGHWGYVRIVGELRKLGISVSATLVRNVLARAGIPPSPERAGPSWRSFLREHAEAVLACDFFTFETVWLRRLYVLFFVSIGTRRVEYLACTSSPDAGWLSKHANVLMDLDDRGQRVRFLIHDGTRSSAACLTAPSRARASGSSARRSGRRTRTPTRSAGSAACAGASIGCSSSAAADSSTSSAFTQATSTSSVHTEHSTYDHRKPTSRQTRRRQRRFDRRDFDDATSSEERFTSTSSPLDRVCAPHASNSRARSRAHRSCSCTIMSATPQS
jgi:hypothetical protein